MNSMTKEEQLMFIFADLHIRMQVAGPQCGSERTVRADSLSVRSVRHDRSAAGIPIPGEGRLVTCGSTAIIENFL